MLPKSDHNQVYRLHSRSSLQSPTRSPTPAPWRSHSALLLPWPSILCMLSVFALALASFIILQDSNGAATETWPTATHVIQPTVLLAIITVISNSLLRFGFYEGWHMYWWHQSLSPHTLKDLHDHWAAGSFIVDALFQFVKLEFSVLGIAKILTALAAVQGPLLQRAVTTTLKTDVRTIDVEATLAPRWLSRGFTGLTTGRAAGINLLAPGFLPAIQAFNRREAISFAHTPCQGTCRFTLQGAGFDYDCAASTKSYDLSNDAFKPGDEVEVFTTNITYSGEAVPTPGALATGWHNINITTLRKQDGAEKGELEITACVIREGLVKYELELTNGTARLLPLDLSVNNTVSLDNEYSPDTHGMGIWPSTIGGIYLSASLRYVSSASLYMSGAPFTVETEGELAQEYVSSNDSCTAVACMTWGDPTMDILEGVREMMFRAALADTNSTETQRTQAVEQITYQIYVADYRYLAAAIVMPLLSAIAISWLFTAWWDLGRKVSFSPVEIAKAFEAPLFADGGSNLDSGSLLKDVGARKVRYGANGGVMGEEDCAGALRFGIAEETVKPRRGFAYA